MAAPETAPTFGISLAQGVTATNTPPQWLRVVFSWVHSGENMGGAGFYQIESCVGTGCTGFAFFTSAAGGSSSIERGPPDITADTFYRFRIRAVSNFGEPGPWSDILEYRSGKEITVTLADGDWYYPGEDISPMTTTRNEQFFEFPPGTLPANARLRIVWLTVCAGKEFLYHGDGWINTAGALYLVGAPLAFDTDDINMPFGVGYADHIFGEEIPPHACSELQAGMYDYANDPQDGSLALPSKFAFNSVEDSQAEFYDRQYGWILERVNDNAILTQHWQGLRVSGLTARIRYDLEGSAVETVTGHPVVDTTVPCECTPGGANPTTVPDPLLPFAPVYTCIGGGTVEALADLPGIGGCWL